MPTFADALRREVSRLARKEFKSDVLSLRKAVAAHRGEIAQLKRELKSLRAQNKSLAATKKRGMQAAEVTQDQGLVRRGRKPTFSAAGLKAMRLKLGVTQAQMATLLSAASLSVSKWENGLAVPRANQQEKIFALRKVGKRAAARMLEA